MLKLLKSLTTPTPGTYACQLVSTLVKPTSNGGQQLVIEVDDGGGALKLSFFEKHPWFPIGSTTPKGECLSITGTFHADQWGVQCPDLKSTKLTEDQKTKLFAGPPTLAAKQLHDWQIIREIIDAMPEQSSYRALLILFIADHEASFRRAAAARGNHHARRGGLVEHVSFMMRNVVSLCNHYTELYPQMDRNLALCGTFLHDVGKLWENNYPVAGFEQQYDLAAEAIGHIVIGIQIAATYWNRLPESQRSEVHKLRALQHLIASHHGTKEWGSPVEPACPEAIILHFVDNIDAKINMMVDCIATSERPAPFLVKRVFPMERNVILFNTMPPVSGIPKKHRSGGRSNTRSRDDIQNIREMIEQEQPALTPKLITAVRRSFPQLDKAELTALRTMRSVAAAIPHLSTSRTTGQTKTGRTHSYLCSMLNAGYRFTNGRLTTLGSVIVWLLEHPTFTSSAWATKRVGAAIKAVTHQPVPRIPLA